MDTGTSAKRLVVSVGHHWYKVPDAWKHYRTMANNVGRYLARSFTSLVIFITTIPGHDGCDALLVPSQPEEGPLARKWFWSEAVAADQYWPSAFRNQSSFPSRFALMNVSALSWRGDARPLSDCLHWCVPGPPDLVSRYLHHMLYRYRGDTQWGY